MRFGVLWAVLMWGCGGQVTEEPGASDGGTDSVAADGAAGADATRPDASAAAACARICGARAARKGSLGLCEPMLAEDVPGMPSPQPCEAWCTARWSAFSAAERAAFEACASDDPLCFQSIQACMATR